MQRVVRTSRGRLFHLACSCSGQLRSGSQLRSKCAGIVRHYRVILAHQRRVVTKSSSSSAALMVLPATLMLLLQNVGVSKKKSAYAVLENTPLLPRRSFSPLITTFSCSNNSILIYVLIYIESSHIFLSYDAKNKQIVFISHKSLII